MPFRLLSKLFATIRRHSNPNSSSTTPISHKENSEAPNPLHIIIMAESTNVEVAVSEARKSYALQMTPPSSPISGERPTVDDLFSDVDNEDEEMSNNIRAVEKRLSYVVSRMEEEANQVNLPPPLPEVPDDLPIHNPHAYPCRSTNHPLPAPPSKWPQGPVMLRPTPESHTKIRGIRYSTGVDYKDYAGFCAGCILPINTGAEAPGKSLVIDFETKYFVGTLLMRIKEAPPAEAENQSSKSYFDGKKRRFQAIVKGRFKEEIPMSQCVTGQIFDRPTGRLPAKWIVSSGIRFFSILAPQLEATVDGNEPKFLAPLAATAHSVLQSDIDKAEEGQQYCTTGKSEEEKDHLFNYTLYSGATDLEEPVEEPAATSEHSILPEVPNYSPPNNVKSSNASRQKARKKCMNAVSAKKLEEPRFVTNKEYCFEFYQHLLLFGKDMAIDMGMPVGKVSMARPLNGQPIKCMSAVKTADGGLEPLWSFDVWHQSLYPYAEAYYNQNEK